MPTATASAKSFELCGGFRMSLCRSRLRLKPLSHRSNRSVSVTEQKPYAVVSATHRYLTGLDKLPSNLYIYRFTLGRPRARSAKPPFLPVPHRTGLETYRFIRLSSFLVSLTFVLFQ